MNVYILQDVYIYIFKLNINWIYVRVLCCETITVVLSETLNEGREKGGQLIIEGPTSVSKWN